MCIREEANEVDNKANKAGLIMMDFIVYALTSVMLTWMAIIITRACAVSNASRVANFFSPPCLVNAFKGQRRQLISESTFCSILSLKV